MCLGLWLWLQLTLPKTLTLTLNPNPQNEIVVGHAAAAARPNNSSQGFLKIVRLFLYKERRQPWNITVNRYITRNNM